MFNPSTAQMALVSPVPEAPERNQDSGRPLYSLFASVKLIAL